MNHLDIWQRLALLREARNEHMCRYDAMMQPQKELLQEECKKLGHIVDYGYCVVCNAQVEKEPINEQ